MIGYIFEEDYIDIDVAYLIGLVTAKGKLIENEDSRRLLIDFPYSNLTTRAPKKAVLSIQSQTKLKLGYSIYNLV